MSDDAFVGLRINSDVSPQHFSLFLLLLYSRFPVERFQYRKAHSERCVLVTYYFAAMAEP